MENMQRISTHGTSNASQRETSARGFTVMEILVILAVLGILAATAFYSLHSMRPRLALRGVANEISTMLNKARYDAIRFNKTVVGSIRTDTIDPVSAAYNPTGIGNEFLVFEVEETPGNRREINSYRFYRGFPYIHLWGAGDGRIHDTEAWTYPSGNVVFLSEGTVFQTGGYRIAYHQNGIRNTLEIGTPTKAGVPEVRKYLDPADRPASASSQEYFVEALKVTGEGRRTLWVWY